MFYGQDHFVLRERTGGNVSMWTWIMCWGQRRALFCLITQHRHSHCTWRHKSGPVLVLWIQRSSENPALRLEPPGFWLDGAGVLVVPSPNFWRQGPKSSSWGQQEAAAGPLAPPEHTHSCGSTVQLSSAVLRVPWASVKYRPSPGCSD